MLKQNRDDPIAHPEAAYTSTSSQHLRRRGSRHEDNNGIELDDLDHEPLRLETLTPPCSLSERDDSVNFPLRPPSNRSEMSKLKRFWTKHVDISVEHKACRDHLALERTYLAYLRTSLAFTNFGVACAQLFRIQAGPSNPELASFYSAGKTLATLFIVAGILIAVKGAWRFYRQQWAMSVKGRIVVSGWELWAITVVSAGVFLALLGVVVGVQLRADGG